MSTCSAPPREARLLRTTELRVAGEGVKRTIVGHAAVYDQEAEIGRWFREVIRRGAFESALKGGDDVRALFNHDPNLVLGRGRAGTLRLAEDGTGLRVEIDPPDTQVARDLVASIARGDVSQMSFAFRTIEDRWTYSEEPGKPDFREILKVELFDVSPVTFPAYTTTDVGLRGEAGLREHHDREKARLLVERTRARSAAALAAIDLAELEETSAEPGPN